MWSCQVVLPGSWSLSPLGCPSVAGTTASAVICRGDRIFLAHVGDSTVVLAQKGRKSIVLTKDHKPSCPNEKKAIEERGKRFALTINSSSCLSVSLQEVMSEAQMLQLLDKSDVEKNVGN